MLKLVTSAAISALWLSLTASGATASTVVSVPEDGREDESSTSSRPPRRGDEDGVSSCDDSFPLAPSSTHHEITSLDGKRRRRTMVVVPDDANTGRSYAPLCNDGLRVDVRELQTCLEGSCFDEWMQQCTFACTWTSNASATLSAAPSTSTSTPSTSRSPNFDVSSTIDPVSVPSTTEPTFNPSPSEPMFAPSTNEPMSVPSTFELTSIPSTIEPAFVPTTSEPVFVPSTFDPVVKPATNEPVSMPSTSEPVSMPSTIDPAFAPSTNEPLIMPATSEPEPVGTPSTDEPVFAPFTFESVLKPSTSEPVSMPSTIDPALAPSTSEPMSTPSTFEPVFTPSTNEPVLVPSTFEPEIKSPTSEPMSVAVINEPTVWPTDVPSTNEPTSTPSTSEQPVFVPSTNGPVFTPSTNEPVLVPSTFEPEGKPLTSEPMSVALTNVPTLPTYVPLTNEPTSMPSTSGQPVFVPSTNGPVFTPSTNEPVLAPSTFEPVVKPPTSEPMSVALTNEPTVWPTDVPSTNEPVSMPSTSEQPVSVPSTNGPVFTPSTNEPVLVPSTFEPVVKPPTSEPMSVALTIAPTLIAPTFWPTYVPSTNEPTPTPSTSEQPVFDPTPTNPAAAPDSNGFFCATPASGCTNGMFNPALCKCECIPPFCPDARGDCTVPSNNCGGNPWDRCEWLANCPWYVDASAAESCTSGPNVPIGVWEIHNTQAACCAANFPYSERCDANSHSQTRQPSNEPATQNDLYEVIPIKFNVGGLPDTVSRSILIDEMTTVLKRVLLRLAERIPGLKISSVEEVTHLSTAPHRDLRVLKLDVTVNFHVYVVMDEEKRFGPLIITELRDSYDEVIEQIRKFSDLRYLGREGVDINWCTPQRGTFSLCAKEPVAPTIVPAPWIESDVPTFTPKPITDMTSPPSTIALCEAPTSYVCVNGLFNPITCECDCIEPFCRDATGCCTNPSNDCGGNPWQQCTPGINCPWWVHHSTTESCITGPYVPRGVWQIFGSKEICCNINFAYSNKCAVEIDAHAHTQRPSIAYFPPTFYPSFLPTYTTRIPTYLPSTRLGLWESSTTKPEGTLEPTGASSDGETASIDVPPTSKEPIKDSTLAPPTTKGPSRERTLSPVATGLATDGDIYYPNFSNGLCLNDGNYPPDVTETYLFPNATECCDTYFPTNIEACLLARPPTASPTPSGVKGWYPDYDNNICKNDDKQGPFEVNFFYTHKACCGFALIDTEKCLEALDAYGGDGVEDVVELSGTDSGKCTPAFVFLTFSTVMLFFGS